MLLAEEKEEGELPGEEEDGTSPKNDIYYMQIHSIWWISNNTSFTHWKAENQSRQGKSRSGHETKENDRSTGPLDKTLNECLREKAMRHVFTHAGDP